ncbi:argininosuccinate lyase, partial [Desulfobulbus sp. F4]|nr:argininosuccinate lyase [Desulfobulbus sp. F4]
VAFCQQRDAELTDLNLAEMRQFSALIDDDVFAVLSVEGSVNSRVSTGGTAGAKVAEALARAEQQLGIA